jgi:hypothetical protein
MRREDEIEQIERFVKEHGVRKIAPAFVGVVAGALPSSEERARLAAIAVERELTREERLALLRKGWCGGGLPRRRGRPRGGKGPV